MPRSKDTAAIVTYGDHEVITPENNLRGAVAKGASGRSDDPVARAEKALADLSPEFGNWMDAERERLDKARHEFARGPDASRKDALFHAAMTSRAKLQPSASRPLYPRRRACAG